MHWQPIETAPKDRTEVLCWREDCGPFIASYTSADGFPLTQAEIDSMDEESLFHMDWFTQWPQAVRLDGGEAPTHWMPLPAAPDAKCRTCSGHGAVGNILTAGPCPDCTPDPVREVLTDRQITEVLWRTHLRWMEQCGIDTEGMMPTGTWLEHWLIYARAVERAALAAAPTAAKESP